MQPLPEEEWRPIPHFLHYEVSNRGRIRRRGSSKALSPAKTSDGYRRVKLYRGGAHRVRRLHRLVYEAFVSVLHAGEVVIHKNGDPNDARVENLARIPLSKVPRKRTGPPRGLKLDDGAVLRIRAKRAGGARVNELAKEFGVTKACISSICVGVSRRELGGPRTRGRVAEDGIQPVPGPGASPWAIAKRYDREAISRAIRLYRSGVSSRDVGRRFGVSGRTILNWVHSTTRGVGEEGRSFKERSSRAGEDNPKAKLTIANVLEIRRRRARGEPVVRIARAFGVGVSTIYNAVRGTCWKHVEGERRARNEESPAHLVL
jgi:transposase